MAPTHHTETINGIRLHWVEQGQGPVILLLHGFPEFWYSWRHQIDPLAAAGFRVVAPDMRGYNLSAKPGDIDEYRIDCLTSDIAALINRVSPSGKVVLVGHDWGGLVAWYTAMAHPDLLDRLVIFNCPHPLGFSRALHRLSQKRRAWYQFAFQIPLLPELLLSFNDCAMIRRTLRRLIHRREALTRSEVEKYVEAMKQPGALRGMINYYRAIGRHRRWTRSVVKPITVPTLVVWSEDDPFFISEAFEHYEGWLDRYELQRVPGAGHFIQADLPEWVVDRIIGFSRDEEPPLSIESRT